MQEPWYKDNPDLDKLFNRMAGLPLEFQRLIAGEICKQSSTSHSEQNGSMNSLKSLGAKTVLSMMNFRGGEYWFNRDKTVRQAVLTFPSLSPQQQQEMLLRLSLSVAMCDSANSQLANNNPDAVRTVVNNIFNRDVSELRKLTRRQR